MGKKFFTSTIPILTLTSLMGSTFNFAPPANAVGEDSPYWSFSEILELEKETTAAAHASCGASFQCERDYLSQLVWDHYEDDPRYMLVNAIRHSQFRVTRINPTAETVSIYYHDEDYMDSEYTGEEIYSHLKGLYMVWADEPSLVPMNMLYLTDGKMGFQYVVDMDNGTLPDGIHVVFSHTTSDGSPSAWLTSGEESVLNAAGSNLANNPSNRLYYSVYSDGDFNAMSIVDYDMFMRDYEPGMEYQLMFGKDDLCEYWVPQWPGGINPSEPEPTEPTTDLEEPSEPDGPTEPSESGSTDPAPTTDPEQSGPNQTEPNAPSTSEITELITRKTIISTIRNNIYTSEISTNTMGVPEIAQTTVENIENREKPDDDTVLKDISTDNYVEVPLAANNQEEHTFPWWLIVFALSGIFLFLWWFIPVRRRKDDEED